jgi:hypothetical protein
MTYLLRSQGQFENLDEIRELVVMTRAGVPVYLQGHRGGQGFDRGFPLLHADQRPARRADADHEAVGPEHRRRSPTR